MLELLGLTIHEMSDLLRNREVSAVEITKSLLDRIENLDSQLGSYLLVSGEDAVKTAVEVQNKLDRGEAKSPLAGIPVALKDNICTEGVRTTCASKFCKTLIPLTMPLYQGS